jgi:hypothetical protein
MPQQKSGLAPASIFIVIGIFLAISQVPYYGIGQYVNAIGFLFILAGAVMFFNAVSPRESLLPF